MKPITLTNENFLKVFKIKSTSVRAGVKFYSVGKTFIKNVDTQEVIECTVTKIELMKMSDLDHRHAIDDGFHSLGELLRELDKHYGAIKFDDYVTVITFAEGDF